MGSWTRNAVLTLARNCQSLESLTIGVEYNETPYGSGQGQTWEPSLRALTCLKSVSISLTSTCKTCRSRKAASGCISRLMLRQAPVLQTIKFCWTKIKGIEEEIKAVDELLFYFIGLLALEEISGDQGLLSQADSASSRPIRLQKVEICVCPCNSSTERACPRCNGHPQGGVAWRLGDNDERLVSLSTQLAETFNCVWQDFRDRVSCRIWTDTESFWHVSVNTTYRRK
jgi:hypothetical protein